MALLLSKLVVLGENSMKIIHKIRAILGHPARRPATQTNPTERFDVVCLSGCGWGAFGIEVTEIQAHNRGVLHSGTAHRGDGKFYVQRSR
ncbi:hypothetical protein PBI_ATRAXA_21 [Arthrobacter phage Atraxa]|uniref:Uncharacterized protein n=1 Tax=Arthrobacter phage Atraxa TaxID=2419947 RepID=A0A3G2KD93_9CAUD|nr:hypothetical protein PP342_gp21 [Arthrobacter phage Atraxa]AYN56974.1 hypothetical protein PBI_ATRAXA_21 [Arthrobacter phage Atraxa]AYN59082.1 hypothetical protein PBI_SPUTNIK_21 [Arthrobacter phage Sputnik]